jgi:hypothetical protein
LFELSGGAGLAGTSVLLPLSVFASDAADGVGVLRLMGTVGGTTGGNAGTDTEDWPG